MSIYCYKCSGEWLFIINVALISIYRYVCGLNGSLYSNMSPQCGFIVISVRLNGSLYLGVVKCRFIAISVWRIGYFSLMSP